MLYATSEKGEGYLAYWRKKTKTAMKPALHMVKRFLCELPPRAWMTVAASGGEQYAKIFKKEPDYIAVSMVVVMREFQGKGFMHKVLEQPFAEADSRNIPCVLDTDTPLKVKKYIHCGMELYGEKKKKSKAFLCIQWCTTGRKGEAIMTSEQFKKITLKEFDEAAEKFDDNDPGVYNMCRKDYPDVLVEVIKEPFSELLDAGCGTGAMLGMFKQDFPDKNYTGIDLSEKMIETAKRKKLAGVNFVSGDCEDLPFAENSFDVVTCSMSFHHYPNPEKFFQSLQRVLRPGGRLILRDMASKSGAMMWFFNYIEIPVLRTLLRKGDVHVYTKKDIQKLCDISGLKLELYEVRKGFRLHCVVRKA